MLNIKEINPLVIQKLKMLREVDRSKIVYFQNHYPCSGREFSEANGSWKLS
jgi:hypothetical protein